MTLSRREKDIEQSISFDYENRNGRIAREEGRGREACPFQITDQPNRGYWLSGWHDRDIELRQIDLLDGKPNA